MKKFYHYFFRKLRIRANASDAQLHLLNETEVRQIQLIEGKAMMVAATMAAIGFLLYYLPIYRYPDLFPVSHFFIPYLNYSFDFGVVAFIWGIILGYIEVYLLTLLNIFSVHEIGVVSGYIRSQDKEQRAGDILNVGLQVKDKSAQRYGIDPFQGLNKSLLFFFNLVLFYKGMFANMLVRVLLRKVLGRYAFRVLLDMAGIPIYAAINAWSTRRIIREAKVFIMGSQMIRMLGERFDKLTINDPEFHLLLYDTLQYIAISKRDYHSNHAFLTKVLLESFQIPSKSYHLLEAGYFERFSNAPTEHQEVCRRILIAGLLLDGQLSWREKIKIRQLHQAGIISEDFAAMQGHLRSFLDGKGLEV